MKQELKSRFHLFKQDGQNVAFDCRTFTSLLVDDLAFDALSLYEQRRGDHQAVKRELCRQYRDEAVREVLEEIEALRVNGYLVDNDALPSPPRTDAESVKRLKSSSITLMMTQRCNLRCTYCYSNVGAYGAHPAFMSAKVARWAVDFMVERSGDVDVCRVSFFGGEPLLNFGLIQEVVAYCDTIARGGDKNFFHTITTNGTLLTDEILTFLSERDIGIILSLDGPHEVYDACRRFPDGRGSFDRVMKAARKIKDFDRPLWVRATLTRRSLPLPDLVEFFEHQVGADRVLVSPVMDVSNSRAGGNLRDLLTQQIEVGKQSIWHFAEGEAVSYNPFLTPLNRLYLRRGAVFPCSAGKGMSAVATNGDIYPCHRFVGLESFVIGNVEAGMCPERLTAFYNNLDDASEECKSCWAYYLCSGGCPRRRALNDGTFAPPDQERCNYYRDFYEAVLGMYAMLKKNHPDVFERTVPPQYPITGQGLPFV